MTIDKSKLDSSKCLDCDAMTDNIPTKTNVTIKILLKLLGEIIFNKNATNTIPNEIDIVRYLGICSIGRNGLIRPMADAIAAAIGRIKISAYPSFPISPLTAKLTPK